MPETFVRKKVQVSFLSVLRAYGASSIPLRSDALLFFDPFLFRSSDGKNAELFPMIGEQIQLRQAKPSVDFDLHVVAY